MLNSQIGNYHIINNSQNLIEIIDYFNLLKEKLIEIENKKPILGVDEDLEKQKYFVKKNNLSINNLKLNNGVIKFNFRI